MTLDLAKFGSIDKPLRASQLHKIVACAWRGVFEMLNDEGVSGKAADTGSAMHLAAATWHGGKGVPASIAAMNANAAALFPLADLDEAARIFERYRADPRNNPPACRIAEIEVKGVATLEPWVKGEPPIVIHGTADQIRIGDDGMRYVWDIKTGAALHAAQMQAHHAYQLAAYAIATKSKPGGFIRTKGYFTRGAELPSPHGVFVPADFTNPYAVLDAVRLAVSLIRSGNVTASPGDACGMCVFAGLSHCLPKLSSFLETI